MKDRRKMIDTVFRGGSREPRNRFDKEITTPANYAHPRIPDESHEWRNWSTIVVESIGRWIGTTFTGLYTPLRYVISRVPFSRPSFNGAATLISHSGGKAVNVRRMIYPAVVPVATITRTRVYFHPDRIRAFTPRAIFGVESLLLF